MADDLQWYKVRQNNSGGSFDYDSTTGISVEIFIQAPTVEDARDVQSRIGAMDNSDSCSCCGDRWSEVSTWGKVEADDVPERDAVMVIDKNAKNSFTIKWTPKGKYEAFIHPWEQPFYGAHKELKVIPRTMTGFGMRYSEDSVGKIFPVGEDGWSEDENVSAPAPNSERWSSDIKIIVDERHLRIEEYNYGGATQYIAWARKSETLEKLLERVESYAALKKRPSMDVQGMVKGL